MVDLASRPILAIRALVQLVMVWGHCGDSGQQHAAMDPIVVMVQLAVTAQSAVMDLIELATLM